MALAPGTQLGPYEVLALLGAGGMGEVLPRARVPVSGGLAVKMLLPPATEIDPATYAPRVTVPVLMVNGRSDFIFPSS